MVSPLGTVGDENGAVLKLSAIQGCDGIRAVDIGHFGIRDALTAVWDAPDHFQFARNDSSGLFEERGQIRLLYIRI